MHEVYIIYRMAWLFVLFASDLVGCVPEEASGL